MTPAFTGPATAWAVEALVASAVLMAIVLAARAPVRRAFGPTVAYALWALPVLRLLLPPLPADVTEQATMPISRAAELVLVLPTDAAPAADTAATVPWVAIGLAAWALGAVAFFALHLLRHRSFCRRLLVDARVLDDVGGIRVIESDAASGPLAFGTLQRFVAFPRDFAERYDADERELALLHELGHHQRRDLWANWVALAVLALHWFNPLAWRAFRAFRCDQELANDARVLTGRGRADRHIYACAIVKAAHGGHVSAACHLHTIADLKGRLRMLTRARPSRRRLAAGTTAVGAVVAVGLCLTASGTRAAAAVTERISETVGVDIAQASPAVPEAPATPEPPVAAAPARSGGMTSVHVSSVKGAGGEHRRVTVHENGVTRVYVGDEARAYIAAHPVPTPPAPPTVPGPVAAPYAPPAPPAPAAPPAKPVRVQRQNDGSWRIGRIDGAPIAPTPAPVSPGRVWRMTPDAARAVGYRIVAPEVSERTCVDGRDGGPGDFVLQRGDRDHRVTIVCRNRVDRVAQEASRRGLDYARDAERRARTSRSIARDGRRQALASIRSARFGLAANRYLTEDQRREVLTDLTRSEAELRARKD